MLTCCWLNPKDFEEAKRLFSANKWADRIRLVTVELGARSEIPAGRVVEGEKPTFTQLAEFLSRFRQ